MNTLDRLNAKYNRTALTLDEVREEAFPTITTKHLRRLIGQGKVKLQLRPAHAGSRAQAVIYITDLATYLDAHNQSTTPAAHQAA